MMYKKNKKTKIKKNEIKRRKLFKLSNSGFILSTFLGLIWQKILNLELGFENQSSKKRFFMQIN